MEASVAARPSCRHETDVPKNVPNWSGHLRCQVSSDPLQLESSPAPNGFPGQLLDNRHLRHVLQAKGYKLHCAEQGHGHDSVVWAGVLAEGLIAIKR